MRHAKGKGLLILYGTLIAKMICLEGQNTEEATSHVPMSRLG